MKNDPTNYGRLIAVFFLGVLLWTYPILSLFDYDNLMFGFPLLFLYIFATWVGLIALIFIITRKPSVKRRPGVYSSKPPATHKIR